LPLAPGEGDLLRIGVDAGHLPVSLVVEQADEIARAARDDQDARLPVRRHVRQVVDLVELVEGGVAALDVLGGLPVGVERLQTGGQLFVEQHRFAPVRRPVKYRDHRAEASVTQCPDRLPGG